MSRAWHLYYADRRRRLARAIGCVMATKYGRPSRREAKRMVGFYEWKHVGDARVRPGHGEIHFANGAVLDIDGLPPLRVERGAAGLDKVGRLLVSERHEL